MGLEKRRVNPGDVMPLGFLYRFSAPLLPNTRFLPYAVALGCYGIYFAQGRMRVAMRL